MTEPTISVWLQTLGLGEYTSVFEANHITVAMLPDLSDDDLKTLGVAALGHRKIILKAASPVAAAPAPAAPVLPQIRAMTPPGAPAAPATPPASPAPAAPAAPARTASAPPHVAAMAPKQPAQRFVPPGVVVPPGAKAAARSVPKAPPAARVIRAAPPPAAAVVVAAPPPAAPKPRVKNKRRLFSGGFLFYSILFHVLLGLGASYFIVQQIYAKRKLSFQGGPPVNSPSKRALEHKISLAKKKNAGGAPAQAKRIATTGMSKIALPDMPAMPVASAQFVPGRMAGMGGAGFGSGFGFGSGTGNGMGGGGGGGDGIAMLPPSMKSRCSSTDRLQKLHDSGVPEECEQAVTKALNFFKASQNPDGSWGTADKGAMTGFVMLCYLGRCETPDSRVYGDTVLKGIMYLVQLAKTNPEGIFSEHPDTNHAVYEHGIATYALGEMFTLARLGSKQLPGMSEAFQTGVSTIIKHQIPDGGWGYGGEKIGYRNTGKGDLSVSGWQYQALKSARYSGLKIPNLNVSITNAIKYLESKQTKDGGFGANNREQGYNQWTLTGVGVLGLQTLAHNKSAQIKKGIKFAYDLHQKERPEWGTANLYAWYYYAQIYFQEGGLEMKYWNDTALPAILKNQGENGAWKGKTIYDTALCSLMLEVYYRYLKVADREEESVGVIK